MKRSLKIKKADELIKELLSSHQQNNAKKEFNLFSIWKSIMGQQVLDQTQHITLKNQTLHIRIANQYLKTDLIAQKSKILKEMQRRKIRVRSIIFN